eukprot:1760862-Pyramimonas_sp.AAC.1
MCIRDRRSLLRRAVGRDHGLPAKARWRAAAHRAHAADGQDLVKGAPGLHGQMGEVAGAPPFWGTSASRGCDKA